MENFLFESSPEKRVLILAPIGKDAALASHVLSRAGIDVLVVPSVQDLCECLNEPLGALLLTEEAISLQDCTTLKMILAGQETWSDIPIVLLSTIQDRVFSAEQILDVFSVGGNIAILERPFRTKTLVSAVRVALRARAKQYQVRDLLRQQAVALTQRDEFLSIASHELKTPLTPLKLQTQIRRKLIRNGDPSIFSPEKVTQYVELVENQTRKLIHLVDDMLDISRVETGKFSIHPELLNLMELVNEVAADFGTPFRQAGIEVCLNGKKVIEGYWDRCRIEQVVANLFSNAIKYGAGKPIEIEVFESDNNACIRVRDQGIGLAKEHHERIFRRFERGVIGTSISGLGLGLYICKEIVNLHHGKIYLESDQGMGAVFTVELPLFKEGVLTSLAYVGAVHSVCSRQNSSHSNPVA